MYFQSENNIIIQDVRRTSSFQRQLYVGRDIDMQKSIYQSFHSEEVFVDCGHVMKSR